MGVCRVCNGLLPSFVTEFGTGVTPLTTRVSPGMIFKKI